MSYDLQYCPKLVILSQDKKNVLLWKRRGKLDYDGIFALVGSKMNTDDASILDWIARIKREEVWSECQIRIYPTFSHNVFFQTGDGKTMILPHYLAIYDGGEIQINQELYSEYRWMPLDEIDTFEPKIPTIPIAIRELVKLEKISTDDEFVTL